MNRQVILQKFYVYDPSVHLGDELGGLRVIKDDKSEDLHILAMPQQVQWWFDQGLLGREPRSKLSGPGKKFLAQITRGRSENPDDDPARIPKYSRETQSGAPTFALSSPSVERKKKRKRDRQEGEEERQACAEEAGSTAEASDAVTHGGDLRSQSGYVAGP